MSEQDAKTPEEDDGPQPGQDPQFPPRPEAEAAGSADEVLDADAPLAPAAEPIEAEFEPADSLFRRFVDRSVSMPIALGLAAAAAVLGGVFGVVFDGGGGPSAAQVEAAVATRLAPVEARVGDLAQALSDAAAQGGGVEAAALASLESDLAGARTALQGFESRLRVVEASRGNGEAAAALADELVALQASVENARLMAEDSAAAISAQTAELQALDARLSALADTAQAQGRAIEQLSNASSVIAGRVTGVPAPVRLASAGAAAALSFASLQEAALSGEPFEVEAEDAAAYFAESQDMAVLLELSPAGAPTPTQLAQRFRAAAQAARDAEAPAGGGVVDRLGRAVAGLVTVRRLDAPETDTLGDVIVRAQRRLEADDLPGAAAELDRLQGPAHEAVAAWIAEARARAEIVTRIDALRASLAER